MEMDTTGREIERERERERERAEQSPRDRQSYIILSSYS